MSLYEDKLEAAGAITDLGQINYKQMKEKNQIEVCKKYK